MPDVFVLSKRKESLKQGYDLIINSDKQESGNVLELKIVKLLRTDTRAVMKYM